MTSHTQRAQGVIPNRKWTRRKVRVFHYHSRLAIHLIMAYDTDSWQDDIITYYSSHFLCPGNSKTSVAGLAAGVVCSILLVMTGIIGARYCMKKWRTPRGGRLEESVDIQGFDNVTFRDVRNLPCIFYCARGNALGSDGFAGDAWSSSVRLGSYTLLCWSTAVLFSAQLLQLWY